MALILALNPANSHSPTLSRLARELRGCELIGAESCVVAISAIRKRVPDIVLLPARSARGEADLIAHLKSIPGGVMTLTLPPVESADPVDLARQIRELLTGVPVAAQLASGTFGAASRSQSAPVGTSPHLLAAAAAAIEWIRTRRAQWSEERALQIAAAASAAVDEPRESRAPHEPAEPFDPSEPYAYEPIEPAESGDPYATESPEATHEAPSTRPSFARYATRMTTWLPRAAALAAAIGIAAALVTYWPQIRGMFSSPAEQFVDAPGEISRPAVEPEPLPPQPAAKPEPDPVASVSGWVAVFAPFDVTISEGDQGIQVDDRGRAMLAPGRHRLRFQNLALGYDETRTVNVRPTSTTTINLNPQTTIGITSSEPAEVLIDGTRVGDTPYEGTVGLGTRSMTVRTAGAERQITVEATSKPVRLEIDFSKP